MLLITEGGQVDGGSAGVREEVDPQLSLQGPFLAADASAAVAAATTARNSSRASADLGFRK